MSDADLVKELRHPRWVDGAFQKKLFAAADRIEALAAEVERLGNERDEFAAILASPLADKVVEYGDRAESAERALADHARHEQTLRDNGIPSHSHAVVIICDLRRALAEIDRIVRTPTSSGEKAHRHYQRDFDAIRRVAASFITAQEKEK